MRIPIFIPLALATIFLAQLMIKSFDSAHAWTKWVAIPGFGIGAVLTIVSLLSLIRNPAEKNHH